MKNKSGIKDKKIRSSNNMQIMKNPKKIIANLTKNKNLKIDKDMSKKIAIGATGVAITAGAVAAGAMLIDKKTRANLAKGATKAFSSIQKIATNLAKEDQIQVLHRVKSTKKRK